MYDGFRDPVDHVENFKAHVMLHSFLDEIAYRAFPLTLREIVREWFDTLRLGTIDSFGELTRQFIT